MFATQCLIYCLGNTDSAYKILLMINPFATRTPSESGRRNTPHLAGWISLYRERTVARPAHYGNRIAIINVHAVLGCGSTTVRAVKIQLAGRLPTARAKLVRTERADKRHWPK